MLRPRFAYANLLERKIVKTPFWSILLIRPIYYFSATCTKTLYSFVQVAEFLLEWQICCFAAGNRTNVRTFFGRVPHQLFFHRTFIRFLIQLAFANDRRSREFFCAGCTKFFHNVDRFCAKRRKSHLYTLHKKLRKKNIIFVQKVEIFFSKNY